MVIYILRDTTPEGGYFCAEALEPEPGTQRPQVVECRSVEVAAEWWASVLRGELPVDEDGSNDSTWAALWPEATPVWSR